MIPFRYVVKTGRTVFGSRHEIAVGGRRRVLSVNAAPLATAPTSGLSPESRQPSRGVVAALEDITDQVETEEQIRSTVREKDVLLREIHHRVKNNLTIITSLLSLQQGRIENAEQAVEAFAESRSRVHALAQLHQMLYQSENLEVIDFADYLRDAVSRLRNAYDPGGRVTIRLDLDSVELDMDSAIPAGLIFTELFSNAFKHGTSETTGGQLRVSLRRGEDSHATLEVADGGTAGPSEHEQGGDSSLGLELVQALTEQVRGRLEIDTDQGMRVRVDFPITR
jgi:two-component sensor histidine kinase